MEKVVNQILQLTEHLWDKSTRNQIVDLTKLFLNRRSKGNRMVLLGLHNHQYVIDRIGRSADEYIKDNATYLVRIKKSNNNRVHFSFRRPEKGISTVLKTEIKDMFQYFGCTDVNLDASLNAGTIPTLSINNDIEWLIQNRNQCLKSLMGDETIEIMTIETSNIGGNGLISSVDDMLIIPQNSILLAENSLERSLGKTQSFWEYATMRQIGMANYYLFNFAVLNSVNDHLIRAFGELLNSYKEHFKLGDSNTRLLTRTFFLSSDQLLSNSRYSELNLGVDFGMLKVNIDTLKDDLEDAEAYSQILDTIITSGNHFYKQNPIFDSYNHIFKGSIEGLSSAKKTISQSINEIEEYAECIRIIHNNIENLTIKDKDTLVLSNCIGILRSMLQISRKHCSTSISNIEACSNKVIEKKLSLAKKTNTRLGNSVISIGELFSKEKEFEMWFANASAEIKACFNTIVNDSQFAYLDSIIHTIKQGELFIHDIESREMTHGNSLTAGILIGETTGYLANIKQLFSSIKDATSHNSMYDGIITNDINQIINSSCFDADRTYARIKTNRQIIDQWEIEKLLKNRIDQIINQAIIKLEPLEYNRDPRLIEDIYTILSDITWKSCFNENNHIKVNSTSYDKSALCDAKDYSYLLKTITDAKNRTNDLEDSELSELETEITNRLLNIKDSFRSILNISKSYHEKYNKLLYKIEHLADKDKNERESYIKSVIECLNILSDFSNEYSTDNSTAVNNINEIINKGKDKMQEKPSGLLKFKKYVIDSDDYESWIDNAVDLITITFEKMSTNISIASYRTIDDTIRELSQYLTDKSSIIINHTNNAFVNGEALGKYKYFINTAKSYFLNLGTKFSSLSVSDGSLSKGIKQWIHNHDIDILTEQCKIQGRIEYESICSIECILSTRIRQILEDINLKS